MNSKAVGEVSEANVLAALMTAGYAVSIPFGNNQRYDMVIEKPNGDGNLLKVQCKTGRLYGGAIGFPCANNAYGGVRKDYRGQVDLFAVFCPENSRVYIVPIEKCGVSLTSMRVDYCILGEIPNDHFKVGRDEVPEFAITRSQTVSAKEYHERTRKINLSPEALRALVWSKPIREVASDLGVSDTAVKKACKRLNVETPPQGHWLRK
jgi:hypothetical protein